MSRLSELRRLLDGATDGCRTPIGAGDGWCVQVPTEHHGFHHSIACGLQGSDGGLSEADARFLAVCDKATIAALLDVAEAAEDSMRFLNGGLAADHAYDELTAALAPLIEEDTDAR